jgi:hypothetical protein
LAIDVPAKLGVIGAGPAGLETTLYARFLGYEVVLLERAEPADRVRGGQKLGCFGDLSSTLGRAAIVAQWPDRALPLLTTPMNCEEWRRHYLLPLSECDLVVDCLHTRAEVTKITKEHLEGMELTGFERGGYDFIVEYRDSQGANQSITVDGLIDASGCEVLGGKPAINYSFASSLDLRLDAQTGAPARCDLYMDELPDGAKLTDESRSLLLHEPNFYVIGDKSSPEASGTPFTTILRQIRAIFTVLGDRTSLDLYATAVKLPQ